MDINIVLSLEAMDQEVMEVLEAMMQILVTNRMMKRLHRSSMTSNLPRKILKRSLKF